MPLFRKKPVVIQARLFDTADYDEALDVVRWCGGRAVDDGCEIPTLEDGVDGRAKHVASPGDWIIRGVQGEFYPCKPDIFEATYEPVGAGSPDGTAP